LEVVVSQEMWGWVSVSGLKIFQLGEDNSKGYLGSSGKRPFGFFVNRED
jgi:hypothetical protein